MGPGWGWSSTRRRWSAFGFGSRGARRTQREASPQPNSRKEEFTTKDTKNTEDTKDTKEEGVAPHTGSAGILPASSQGSNPRKNRVRVRVRVKRTAKNLCEKTTFSTSAVQRRRARAPNWERRRLACIFTGTSKTADFEYRREAVRLTVKRTTDPEKATIREAET